MITREQAKKCVGQGWHGLIDEFYNAYPDVNVIQVKEKYGGLCLYHSGGNNDSLDLEITIRERSTEICEECGEWGENQEINHWIYTLCKKHADEKKIK